MIKACQDFAIFLPIPAVAPGTEIWYSERTSSRKEAAQMPLEIVIPVKLDEKTFKRFARFDMFILRKHWVRPLIFSLLLTAFAIVALFV